MGSQGNYGGGQKEHGTNAFSEAMLFLCADFCAELETGAQNQSAGSLI